MSVIYTKSALEQRTSQQKYWSTRLTGIYTANISARHMVVSFNQYSNQMYHRVIGQSDHRYTTRFYKLDNIEYNVFYNRRLAFDKN